MTSLPISNASLSKPKITKPATGNDKWHVETSAYGKGVLLRCGPQGFWHSKEDGEEYSKPITFRGVTAHVENVSPERIVRIYLQNASRARLITRQLYLDHALNNLDSTGARRPTVINGTGNVPAV